MKKVFDNPFFMYLIIAILAFVIILVSVSSVSIQQMGNGDFFVESILPIPYWIGIAIITCVAFFAIRYLSDKRSILISVFISLILLVSFRIAFPVMFTSIPAYEPDAINYMNIVNSWVKGGVDFGFPGYYQHDYPLSFLTAFTFVKFGVPVDTFFRVAPFVIYAIDLLMLYLIVAELIPGKKKLLQHQPSCSLSRHLVIG